MLRKHIVGIITSCYIMRIYYMCDVWWCGWHKIKEYVFASGPPSLQRVKNYNGAPCVYTTALSLAVQSRACNSGDSY